MVKDIRVGDVVTFPETQTFQNEGYYEHAVTIGERMFYFHDTSSEKVTFFVFSYNKYQVLLRTANEMFDILRNTYHVYYISITPSEYQNFADEDQVP